LRSRVDLEVQPIGRKPRGKRGSKNARRFDLRSELYRITGIDWAQIHGIYVPTAQTVIAETGADLRAFPGESSSPAGWDDVPPSGQSGQHRIPQLGLDPAPKQKAAWAHSTTACGPGSKRATANSRSAPSPEGPKARPSVGYAFGRLNRQPKVTGKSRRDVSKLFRFAA
jgi:hypothetical protein